MHLLLVEDYVGASVLLARNLMSVGFWARTVTSYDQVLSHAFRDRIGAVVIDQTGPNELVISAIRSLRSEGLNSPLLLLTTSSDWREKVAALDSGADDIACKPIRSEEVAARLRAIVRRSLGQTTNRFSAGGFELDMQVRCAWLNGECLNLSPREFHLLRALALASPSLVERKTLRALSSVSGTILGGNALEVQIARLRRKVGVERIKTVRGIGYRIELD
jgi:two-component system, OmpR family, response regulator